MRPTLDDDHAPPFLTIANPYGGIGLKVGSAAGARRRIDGLLAALGAEVILESAMSIPRAMRDALMGGDRGPRSIEASLRSFGHVHDPLSAEAWERFGTPSGAGTELRDRRPEEASAEWSWVVEGDPLPQGQVSARFEAFYAFLTAHDQEMRNTYTTRVRLTSAWRFVLKSAAGAMPPATVPYSSILATLCGRHASAFFHLAFPHERVDDAFLRDLEAVEAALGMALPRSAFQSSVPRRGGGRTRRKVALPAR